MIFFCYVLCLTRWGPGWTPFLSISGCCCPVGKLERGKAQNQSFKISQQVVRGKIETVHWQCKVINTGELIHITPLSLLLLLFIFMTLLLFIYCIKHILKMQNTSYKLETTSELTYAPETYLK